MIKEVFPESTETTRSERYPAFFLHVIKKAKCFIPCSGIWRKKLCPTRIRDEEMKKLLLAVIVTMLSCSSFAQWNIGLSGGYAYNHYSYDPQYMVGLDFKGHHGFAIDVPVNYQFNDWFGLSTGLSFQWKGYMLNGSYTPEGSNEPWYFYNWLDRKDYYLVVPVMTEYTFGNKEWKGFANVGGYAGWWTCSYYMNVPQMNSTQISQDFHFPLFKLGGIRREFNEAVDQRWEFGAIAGLGIKKSVSKKITLFLVARTFFAFTPQQKDYQIMHFPSHNITFTAQFGFLYHIN